MIIKTLLFFFEGLKMEYYSNLISFIFSKFLWGAFYLGTKFLGDQISWGPNFLGTKFLGDQKGVRPKFLGTKFLGDQISWGPKKSGAQMCSGTNSVTAVSGIDTSND